MPFTFQPMPLLKRRLPFDDPEWLFELKYDGFRALAHVRSGQCQLISRNGNPFTSFSGLAAALLGRTCKLQLEGIVAKHNYAPYVSMREQSTWFKIRNPRYSQWAGREKLFERDRNREPVPGWHCCALACVELLASATQSRGQ